MVDTDRPTTPNADCTHPVVQHYHGTLGSYISDRCRCAECSGAMTVYGRSYRLRRGDPVAQRFGDYLKPRSPEWLAVMRAGLRQAVDDSIRRHGKVEA